MSQPAPFVEALPEAPPRSIKKRLSVPALPRCEEVLECPPTPPAEAAAVNDEEKEPTEPMSPDSGTSSHCLRADTSIWELEEEQFSEEFSLSPARPSIIEAEAKSPFLSEIKRILDDSPDEDSSEH